MDSSLIDTLRHRLQNYDLVVEETREQFRNRKSTGPGPAYPPYLERVRIHILFDTLAEEGAGIPPELWQKYSRITRRFEAFERASGPVYRKNVLNDLMNFIQTYQAALCFAYLGEPSDPPASQHNEREIIGILLNELKKDHDLSEIAQLVASLDRNVARIYRTRTECESDTPVVNLSDPCDTARKCHRGIS